MRLSPALSSPLTEVIKETIRLRAALRWYANEQNYIDGKPMGIDPDGDQTVPDEGIRARIALRMHDIPGPLLLNLSSLENTERKRYEQRLAQLLEEMT